MAEPNAKLYMVVDVEALVFNITKQFVLEQIGFCVIDDAKNIIMSCKIIVFQPHSSTQLSDLMHADIREVNRSIYFYQKITGGDSYIHNKSYHMPKDKAMSIVVDTARTTNATVFAKGRTLESKVFGDSISFVDLEWYNCPKYPLAVHDPLQECIFFANFVPVDDPYQSFFNAASAEPVDDYRNDTVSCSYATPYQINTSTCNATYIHAENITKKKKTYAEATKIPPTTPSPSPSSSSPTAFARWTNGQLEFDYVYK